MSNHLPSPKSNVWSYKPWWCQPWSIALTGISIIGGSWLLLENRWVTLLLATPTLLWMGFFLLVYPRLMAAAIAKDEVSAVDTERKTCS